MKIENFDYFVILVGNIFEKNSNLQIHVFFAFRNELFLSAFAYKPPVLQNKTKQT